MKRIISLIIVLCLLPTVIADTEVDIDITSSETINADITLNGANQNVNINGGELANKEYINSLGKGGARNRMVSIFLDAIRGIKEGTIFNPQVHKQTAMIGQALVTTFITRSESDLDWLYYSFRERLVKDMASGKIDQLVLEEQNKVQNNSIY